MKNQQGLKLFVVLLVSTLFIYSFSHFGALTYNAMTTEDDLFLQGTSIGSVDVAGTTRDDALIAVTDRLQQWQNGTKINLKYKEKTIAVNLEIYQFDIQGSVTQAQNGHSNAALVSIDPQGIKTLLTQLSPKLQLEDEELTRLNNELVSYANNLNIGEHKVSIEKLLESSVTDEVISETVLQLDEASVAMMDWVTGLSPISIPAESQFSFLKVIEEKKLASMPAAAQSMIATGIYETILPTNFVILQRHIGQELPKYTDLGFEAKINKNNNLDLAFTNSNELEYTLEFKWEHPTLTVQLKGDPLLYKYVVEATDKKEFKPKTIIQYSPQLYPSQKTVKETGRNGLFTKVLRKVYGENDEFVSEELISEDYYAPVERVEVHGLKSTTTTTSDTAIPVEGENGTQTPANPSEESTTQETKGKDKEIIYGKPNEKEK
ncbi:G5 domain-containing protein [Mesobacillus maritimus]|uniref:G5 domain-containing protein n=1 Tax=Mesobacillus maritimus TaxID=1643336 RepID=UPI00384C2BDE